jgi:hypothetical protein
VDLDWAGVSSILGVVAFFGLLLQASRRRLSWLRRPAYILSRLEVDPDGGLDAWLILRNGGRDSGYVSSFFLEAHINPTYFECREQERWETAQLIANTAEDALATIPPGDTIKRCRLRVVKLDAQTRFIPPHEELRICREIITLGVKMRVKLDTSEGAIELFGRSLGHPVAIERVPVARRVSRLLCW